MIQFNLLPDVKLEYIKAKRTKRLAILASTIVSGISLAVLITLFLTVSVFQKKYINDLTADIKASTSKLQQTQDLNKILTVQNQLNNLDAIHDQKPVTTRLFTYLPQITPNALTIDNLTLDYATSNIKISGNADAISTINVFVDTLKFTDFSVAGEQGTKKAFEKVVLSSFSLNQQEKDPKKKATYNITFNFNPDIFNKLKEVALTVPKQTTTRSETEKPTAIFDVAEPAEGAGQ
jgi:Fimbrial assembly protein (PilN)